MNNESNLVINYITSDPAMRMVTRVVATGEKQVYTNGQSRSFIVPHGEQIVVLKIGKNYNKTVYISDETVTIYASYDGEPHFVIDQPEVDMEYMQSLKKSAQTATQQSYQQPDDQPINPFQTPSNSNRNLPAVSAKCIASIICGALVFSAPIGLYLAIKDRKDAGITYRLKWFSYIALGVNCFMLFYLVFYIFVIVILGKY